LPGDFRVELDVPGIGVTVGQAGGGLQWQPQITLLVAGRAVLLGNACVPAAVVASFVPGFCHQIDVVVVLIPVGVIKGIPQHLCRRHHHSGAGAYLIRIHFDTVIANAELAQPICTEILMTFQESAVHVTFGGIEVLHKKHRVVGVVDIRIVLRAKGIDTEHPGAAFIVQSGLQLKTQAVAGCGVSTPAVG
jgi:hypothetical protein